MPRLAKIIVYPIKSFDGVELAECGFVSSGALRNDRRFALRTADGKLLNAKRAERMHRLRASFDLAAQTVTFRTGDSAPDTFALAAGNADLERWCCEYFETSVRFVEDTEQGFPDDPDSPSATIISRPTLAAVAGWFPGLDVAEVRRRFRANLEIDSLDATGGDESQTGEPNCPPFWEDRLFSEDAAPDTRDVVEFRIGDVTFQGTNPCMRCPVPTRDSQTGEALAGFARTFADRRRAALPNWAPRGPFDHYYRLAVNTRLGFAQQGKTIRVGDRVALI
jgi:uncharacterized protein YcbX